jgi:hypothetical protein
MVPSETVWRQASPRHHNSTGSPSHLSSSVNPASIAQGAADDEVNFDTPGRRPKRQNSDLNERRKAVLQKQITNMIDKDFSVVELKEFTENGMQGWKIHSFLDIPTWEKWITVQDLRLICRKLGLSCQNAPKNRCINEIVTFKRKTHGSRVCK